MSRKRAKPVRSTTRSAAPIDKYFGDRLRALFEIDPELLESRVPTLLLQPLIENALMHGLAPRRSGGSISIIAKRIEEGVILIVAATFTAAAARAAHATAQLSMSRGQGRQH